MEEGRVVKGGQNEPYDTAKHPRPAPPMGSDGKQFAERKKLAAESLCDEFDPRLVGYSSISPEPHDATAPESLPPQAREVAADPGVYFQNHTPVMVPHEIADILRQAVSSGRFLLLLTRADDERGEVLTVNRYRSGGFSPDWQLRAWQESGRQIMGAGLRPGAE